MLLRGVFSNRATLRIFGREFPELYRDIAPLRLKKLDFYCGTGSPTYSVSIVVKVGLIQVWQRFIVTTSIRGGEAKTCLNRGGLLPYYSRLNASHPPKD